MDKYQDKPFRSVTSGAADLQFLPGSTPPEGVVADLSTLIPALKSALGDAIDDVRPTDRLTGSAVVLAASGKGPDLQLQRMMRRSGRPMPAAPPLLEINPRHGLIHALAARAAAGEDVSEAALTLFDLAQIQEGESPKDPAAFARRVANALAKIP
jgi:molecular chaperone HtpG